MPGFPWPGEDRWPEAVWVVTTVHGAEAALCWVCSGLGKGTHLATLLLTAHLDPEFNENHSSTASSCS